MFLKSALISRYILGLIYFVFGLNGFLQFMPVSPLPEGAMGFINGLVSSGYFLPVLAGTQIVGGALLLSGFAVPAALVILAPVTVQIILFHMFLTPALQYLVLPVLMVIMHVTAAMSYWPLYRPLFTRKTK